MGISSEPQEVPVSEPVPFCLGPLRDTHPFPLSYSAPIYLLGFLENYHAGMSFSQKGKIILEFDSSHHSSQPGELNDTLISCICSSSGSTNADSGNTGRLSIESGTTLLMGKICN